MTLLPSDHRELLLPIIEGIHADPPFGIFLRNLVARTSARRGLLAIRLAHAAPSQQPIVVRVAAAGATGEPPIDYERMAQIGLRPDSSLRAERVYALDEMLDWGTAEAVARQQAALLELRMPFGRCVRVVAGGVAEAWILLVREFEDFPASASATLTMVAPHLTAGLRSLVRLGETRARAALAETSLARLGLGQLAFDATGRVIAIDSLAETLVALAATDRRLLLPPDAARQFDQACQDLGAGLVDEALVEIDPATRRYLLLRRATFNLAEPVAWPAVVGTIRIDRREDPRAAARILAAGLGLSLREAALAHALSLGMSIVEAGRQLRLTPETARNYSKRVYAKTGARGQADLVRIILTGLAPLA